MFAHSYRAIVGTATVLFCTLAATPARASLLFSNMSPTSPLFSYTGGYFLMGSDFGSQSNNTYAVSFTPAVTEDFYFANFPLRLANAYNDYGTISLCQDSGGLPGAVIESIVSPPIISQSFSSSDAYTSIFSALQPQLDAGTTYWFRIDMPAITSATWLPNNTGDLTTNPGSGFAWTTSGSSPWYSASDFLPYSWWERPAFMVYGSPVSVPEPGSVWLLVIGIGGLAFTSRSQAERVALQRR
jgi:hypothetical protein